MSAAHFMHSAALQIDNISQRDLLSLQTADQNDLRGMCSWISGSLLRFSLLLKTGWTPARGEHCMCDTQSTHVCIAVAKDEIAQR